MRYVLFLVPAVPCAQEFRGTILGRVTDSSGAVVTGAAIRVTNTETGVAVDTKTNSEGNYQVPLLLPGAYEVSVEAAGFKRINRQDIRVSVNSQMTLNFSLEVGAAADSITVTGEAPALNTTNADVGVSVNREYVDRITMNVRRNASSLPMGISQANGRPIRLRNAKIGGPVGDRLGDRRDASGRIVNPYFDTTAFQPLPNQYTVSPEPPLFPELRDPKWGVVNAGVGRTVPIRERFRIEVRGQAWNLLNSPIFAAPGTNMSNAATFGVINALKVDGDARRVEGSLRISF